MGRLPAIYLNGAAYWKNISKKVWEYRIGGYRVIKKLLSYQEQDLLCRPLAVSGDQNEVQEVSYMVRRIAAIVLLEARLDANYAAIKNDTYSWPGIGDN